MQWVPMHLRDDPEAVDAHRTPAPGVPDWLRPPLLDWARETFETKTPHLDGRDEVLLLRVRAFVLFSKLEGFADTGFGPSTLHALMERCAEEDELLLNVVDFQLAHPDIFEEQNRILLEFVLGAAGSIYRVVEKGEAFGLEERVTDEEFGAFEEATSEDSSTTEHLKDAWQSAYGRQPDATRAYSSAIKAVEAAINPLALPADQSATLGKVVGALVPEERVKTPRIETRLTPRPRKRDPQPTSETIGQLLALLWDSQKARHGRSGSERDEENTLDEARDAVRIAVLIVSLCRTGGIRSTSDRQ